MKKNLMKLVVWAALLANGSLIFSGCTSDNEETVGPVPNERVNIVLFTKRV